MRQSLRQKSIRRHQKFGTTFRDASSKRCSSGILPWLVLTSILNTALRNQSHTPRGNAATLANARVLKQSFPSEGLPRLGNCGVN